MGGLGFFQILQISKIMYPQITQIIFYYIIPGSLYSAEEQLDYRIASCMFLFKVFNF